MEAYRTLRFHKDSREADVVLIFYQDFDKLLVN